MLHIAICDDEPAEIAYLSHHVRAWAAERGAEAQISHYPSAESFLFAYEGHPAVDILLLDIQMTGMDGVSLAKSIRRGNKEVQIIFVTGYMDYIADGYEVEALHYLIKPVTGEKLAATLNRAVERLGLNERALFVSHGGEQARIPLYEIRYAEVCHNYVTIHAGQTYAVKKTLGELEKELDSRFFRTGRSHLVNLSCVRKSTRAVVYLSCGAAIPLSRGRYGPLNRALIERL